MGFLDSIKSAIDKVVSKVEKKTGIDIPYFGHEKKKPTPSKPKQSHETKPTTTNTTTTNTTISNILKPKNPFTSKPKIEVVKDKSGKVVGYHDYEKQMSYGVGHEPPEQIAKYPKLFGYKKKEIQISEGKKKIVLVPEKQEFVEKQQPIKGYLDEKSGKIYVENPELAGKSIKFKQTIKPPSKEEVINAYQKQIQKLKEQGYLVFTKQEWERTANKKQLAQAHRVVVVESPDEFYKRVSQQTKPKNIEKEFKIEYGKPPSGAREITLTATYKQPIKKTYEVLIEDPYKEKLAHYKQMVRQIYKEGGLKAFAFTWSQGILSWEDPLNLKTTYYMVASKLGFIPEKEAFEKAIETKAKAWMEWDQATQGDLGKGLIKAYTGPMAMAGVTLISGYGLGAGMGAVTRVAPTVGRVAQYGLAVGSTGYIAYDIGKEIKAKNYEEAFVKAGLTMAYTPMAIAGYKAGYGKGYAWASQKWIEKNYAISKTIITDKTITDKGIVYRGKYEATYRPNLEVKEPIKIKGEFQGIIPNQRMVTITKEGMPLVIEKGQPMTYFKGTGTYKTWLGRTKQIQIETLTKGIAQRRVGPYNYQYSVGIGQAGKEPYVFKSISRSRFIGQTEEPLLKNVELKTFKSHAELPKSLEQEILKGEVLGYTNLKEHTIWVREDVIKYKGLKPYRMEITDTVTGRTETHIITGRHVVKHELLHRIYPEFSENEIRALTIQKHPIENVVNEFFKTGKLNFKEPIGLKKYNLYSYESVGVSKSKNYGYSILKEFGILKEPIEQKEFIREGIITLSLGQTEVTARPQPITKIQTQQFKAIRVLDLTKLFGQEQRPYGFASYGKSQSALMEEQRIYKTFETKPKAILMLEDKLKEIISPKVGQIQKEFVRQRERQAFGIRLKGLQETKPTIDIRQRPRPPTTELRVKLNIMQELRKKIIELEKIKQLELMFNANIMEFTPFILFGGKKAKPVIRKTKRPRLKIRGPRPKAGILEKTLLADLLSVMESQLKFGKATHPRPTKRIWSYARKTLFLDIPTKELLNYKIYKKRKKKYILRW